MIPLIGADPEVFVVNNQTNTPFPAHGLVPGTKDKPYPVKRGAVQVDGMALEFNVRPSHKQEVFVHNITSVLCQLKAMIPENLSFNVGASSTYFDRQQMAELPFEARELGCSFDYNAYTKEANPPPVPTNPSFRTAAGHVHFSWTQGADTSPGSTHFDDCCILVQYFDKYLGVLDPLIDEKADKRRKLYGRAGAFRTKSYGVEYRTLGNWWIFEERYIKLVHKQTYRAYQDAKKGIKRGCPLPGKEELQIAINDYQYSRHTNQILQYLKQVCPSSYRSLVEEDNLHEDF